MNIKMIWQKMCKKQVDERQELELLKIEHIGFWCVFFALLASTMIQALFMNADFKQIAGEWFIFMFLCLFEVIGCVRKGLWGYGIKKKLGLKMNIVYSLIGSTFFGCIFGISSAIRNGNDWMWGALLTVSMIVFLFAILFVTFLILDLIIEHRQKKLEQIVEGFGDEDEE